MAMARRRRRLLGEEEEEEVVVEVAVVASEDISGEQEIGLGHNEALCCPG